MSQNKSPFLVPPQDSFNELLVSHVHPLEWTNPTPAPRYHLVVIGGGPAGLVCAAGAAGLGAKVALVERHLLGGDCLNYGCVPSKTLIRSARAAWEVRRMEPFGIQGAGSPQVDFEAVMERVRRIRSDISRHHDSAERFKGLGIDVFIGSARFLDSKRIKVGNRVLKFKKAVIATGARAVQPEIEGLKEAGCLTNETVFSLTKLPRRLGVVGGGPIGCELAQAFQRLGSRVVLFHKYPFLLNREDICASEIIQKQFEREGIQLILNTQVEKVTMESDGKMIHYVSHGSPRKIVVDEILVGTGRKPNTDDLDLEAAYIDYDPHCGVMVNDRLQTTQPHIFAAGDICMEWKFTHAADAAARIVIQNALFGGRKKLSSLVVPWCTYTDPEIAHVGLYEREVIKQGIEPKSYIRKMSEVDRARTDGETDGFVKVIVQKGTDHILGATIVAPHAGEMIGELTLAMTHGLGLAKIASVIHPYPTQAEAIKQVADAYRRTRLTPFVKKAFEWWFQLTR
jgi:pyruvate/2-oxoglutarate dehydrogenase complex dihydrolipoamide dehydrogenase (E3) component